MVRLVLFDIDGTLILTGKAGQKAFAKACEAVFRVPNGAQHLHFAGRTDTSIVRDFFTGHGIEPSAALQPESYNVRAVDMVCKEPDFLRFMDLYAEEAVGKVPFPGR